MRAGQLNAIATGTLGGVHGRIGLLEKLRGLLCMQRIERTADAGQHLLWELLQGEGGVECQADLLGGAQGMAGTAKVFQQHYEFVTGQARYGIGLAHASLQALGHLL